MKPETKQQSIGAGWGIFGTIAAAFIIWAAATIHSKNTYDDELNPVKDQVSNHDTRLQTEEQATEVMSTALEVQVRQNAFSAIKFASEDLRLLERIPKEQWTADHWQQYNNAKRRLEENQKLIDEQMGLVP